MQILVLARKDLLPTSADTEHEVRSVTLRRLKQRQRRGTEHEVRSVTLRRLKQKQRRGTEHEVRSVTPKAAKTKTEEGHGARSAECHAEGG